MKILYTHNEWEIEIKEEGTKDKRHGWGMKTVARERKVFP